MSIFAFRDSGTE